MKRLVISVSLAVLAVLLVATNLLAAGGTSKIEAYINDDIHLTWGGQEFSPVDSSGNTLAPIIHNGRSYLPVKPLLEKAGYEVEWDANTQTIIITQKSADGAVELDSEQANLLKPGQGGVVSLQENPSTGYSWDYTISDPTVVQFLSDEIETAADGLVGAPETHVWNFQAVSPGTASITFQYFRPWEENQIIDTRVFNIQVQ